MKRKAIKHYTLAQLLPRYHALQKQLHALDNEPVPPFAQWFDSISGTFADNGDFTIEGEAGDWIPSWCEDCATWHKSADAITWSRNNGKRSIALSTVDASGSSDEYERYEEGDPEDRWAYIYRQNFSHAYKISEDLNWADYYFWCAEHDAADPIKNWLRPHTVQDDIDSAAQYLGYAEDYIRRVAKL